MHLPLAGTIKTICWGLEGVIISMRGGWKARNGMMVGAEMENLVAI